MSRIKLIVGDWSHDGHGQTEKHIVECNRSPEQLMAAFNRGCAIIGIETEDKWFPPLKAALKDSFREYEDNKAEAKIADYFHFDEEEVYFGAYIEQECPDTLRAALTWQAEDENPDWKLRPIPLLVLWKEIALLGDPDITLKVVADDIPQIPIGGYGLFSM